MTDIGFDVHKLMYTGRKTNLVSGVWKPPPSTIYPGVSVIPHLIPVNC